MKPIAWIILLVLVSCNNATDKATATTSKTVDSTPPTENSIQAGTANPLAGCYLAVKGRDTIWLQLQVQDSTVSGRMQYDNFEIDGNTGTIKGVVRNGRISGYFTFLSEGMWSAREVVFEERDGQLLQAGTGNMRYQKDTARFTPPVAFDTERPFSRVPCSQVQIDSVPAQNVSNPF